MADAAGSDGTPQEAEAYEKVAKVGEGTYAVVYRATRRADGAPVALKRIKMVTPGVGLDISAIRELTCLRDLSPHPNIIPLMDVYVRKEALTFVLPFYQTDLEMIIRDRGLALTAANIKSWLGMLLSGLEFCHQRGIIHRDIKPNNLLIDDASNAIRIADFGLARTFAYPVERMTSQVVTRWYRSPELLFGGRHYGPPVDVWAVGCIFAELMLRTPFLPGETDMGQLRAIFAALGTPTPTDWPAMASLPDYVPFPAAPPPQPLGTIFTAASGDAIDLLGRMLAFDPARRITAREALSHAYFASGPPPTEPAQLPRTTAATFHAAKEAHLRKQLDADVAKVEPRRLNF